MHVMPVMDVKHGLVVRGIAGNRHRYSPIQSLFAADSHPTTVAKALQDTFGFGELYLADLDAIEGGSPNWQLYEQVGELGLKIVLDAGVTDANRMNLLNRFTSASQSLSGIVVGLESVMSETDLEQIASELDPDRGVFSLDLKLSRPLTRIAPWQSQEPLEIAEIALALGFRKMIVLDLAAVGVGNGPVTMPLCNAIRNRHPNIELVSGGGIRGTEDIQLLLRAGCHRVLVASALHDGRLTAKDLEPLKRLDK